MAASLLLVTIGVFGLFRPKELTLRPVPGQVLLLEAGGEKIVLGGALRLRIADCGLQIEDHGCVQRVSSQESEFILSVPGKIERRFRGRLQVTGAGDRLVAVVALDRETAVASVVAAESPPGASLEALKAQAVVARSFFAAMTARGRHDGFDFCDTTHCQFLREPPDSGDPAWLATAQTRGLILHYRGAALAAYYSANCGGRTRSLAEAGMPAEGYPYFGVECSYCLRNARERRGHGLGLCQEGAAGMAAAGAGFREILGHYYPNAILSSLREEPESR